MPIDQICEPKECTACFACMAVCPQRAISKKRNRLDEEIPVIDAAKCIACGACMAVCPMNHKPSMKRTEYCYAAWSKTEDDLLKSSSGAVSAVLSRAFIREGGVVYGAASCDGQVFHTRIDTLDGIEQLRGSKYVKSDIRNCYELVRADLKDGKKVLFTGTPCQVAGLKAYIGKENQNLATVDLICHGTPPFPYLEEYLKEICAHSKDKAWDFVAFRLGRPFMMKVFRNNNLIYQKAAAEDIYYTAFLEGMIFRSNCYN